MTREQRDALDAEARTTIVPIVADPAGDPMHPANFAPSPHMLRLEAVVTQILLDNLPPGLKAAIDDALAGGHSATAVWMQVQGTAPHGSTLPAACEAYLNSLGLHVEE